MLLWVAVRMMLFDQCYYRFFYGRRFMESIDIAYWLATRDKKRLQSCFNPAPQTLSSSDHYGVFCTLEFR